MRTVVFAFVCMAVAAGLMYLQVFLSKKDNKWLGWIMPIVFFLISFISPVLVFITKGIDAVPVGNILISWLMGNVPTLILIGINYVSKSDQKNQR